jgi:hypothetical protein
VEYRSLSSSLCRLVHSPASSSFFGSNVTVKHTYCLYVTASLLRIRCT